MLDFSDRTRTGISILTSAADYWYVTADKNASSYAHELSIPPGMFNLKILTLKEGRSLCSGGYF